VVIVCSDSRTEEEQVAYLMSLLKLTMRSNIVRFNDV
jgi:hypothetical protein